MILFRYKLNSFSLIEMLVVLVLSSIVVGIVYFSFYNVSAYQLDLTRRYSKFSEITDFYFSLKKDMEESSEIKSINRIEIYCSNERQLNGIRYLFSDRYVLRIQDSRYDTFHITADRPIFKWKGKNRSNNTFGWIDEIQFSIAESSIDIYKVYDASALIEAATDTIP